MKNLPNDDSLLEFEGLLLTSANLAKSLVASWLPSTPNSIDGKTDTNGVGLENSRIGKTTGLGFVGQKKHSDKLELIKKKILKSSLTKTGKEGKAFTVRKEEEEEEEEEKESRFNLSKESKPKPNNGIMDEYLNRKRKKKHSEKELQIKKKQHV